MEGGTAFSAFRVCAAGSCRVVTRCLGGYRALFLGLLLFANIGLLETRAESRLECARRLASVAIEQSIVFESDGGIYIPTAVLEHNPLILRNLVVFVYNHPYLNTFFRGFDSAPLSLHYLRKAYELPAEISKLDVSGHYTLDEILHIIENLAPSDALKKAELDFSRADTKGVYLRFLELKPFRSSVAQGGEFKIRKDFAQALFKKLLGQVAPMPIENFNYVATSQNGFLIESAFFLNQVYQNTKDLFTSEFALASWKPFHDSFMRRMGVGTFAVSTGQGDLTLNLFLRRRHPENLAESLYEIAVEKGELEGDLWINGSRVEWFNEEAGKRQGIVALPHLPDLENIEVEVHQRGVRSKKTFSI